MTFPQNNPLPHSDECAQIDRIKIVPKVDAEAKTREERLMVFDKKQEALNMLKAKRMLHN